MDKNDNALEEVDIIELAKETNLPVKHILHVIDELKETRKHDFKTKRDKKDDKILKDSSFVSIIQSMEISQRKREFYD